MFFVQKLASGNVIASLSWAEVARTPNPQHCQWSRADMLACEGTALSGKRDAAISAHEFQHACRQYASSPKVTLAQADDPADLLTQRPEANCKSAPHYWVLIGTRYATDCCCTSASLLSRDERGPHLKTSTRRWRRSESPGHYSFVSPSQC